MADRSRRPHRSPRRTPTRTERRIIKVRVLRRWGPARIAYLLGLNPATVHRVLTRYGLARLAHLDRATGRVIRRYEHAAPGDLVHVDIKKLGNIPDGGGHKILGRASRPQDPLPAPATATCTPPSTTTPASPTARSSPTRRRRPPPPSGSEPTPSSPPPGSPSNAS